MIRSTNVPSLSYWLLTASSETTKSRLAWCFGIPQIPLPPLTEISVLTGRSRTYCPNPNARRSGNGRRRGAGLRAARAGDPDAELDVLANVGQRVVDDRDQQDSATPEPGGVELVPGQERGSLRGVDLECRHQRGRAVRVDGEHERDAVHQRVAPGLPLHASRNHDFNARARPASAGTRRGSRPCR